jgi:hypothetical protein
MKLHYTLLFLFFTSLAFAQDTQKGFTYKLINLQSIGGFTELGIPMYELPEGNTYMPLLIGGTYNLPLWKAKKKFNISAEFKPQFGYILSTMENYEFGLNVMFNFNFQLGQKSYIAYKMSSGPHYINIETRRQAKGFIFSDNFFLGYYHRLKIAEKYYVLGGYGGIRHISNASIKRPNGGINNWMIGISFSQIIRFY